MSEYDETGKPLTSQQEAFCLAWATIGAETNGRGTESAIAAGYAERSAASRASKLLSRPRIQRRITAIKQGQVDEAGLTAGKVLADLEDTRLRALKVNDLSVAARCSELQGKHLSMWTERYFFAREQPERQQELDTAQAALAQRAALLCFDTVGGGLLPAGGNGDGVGDEGSGPPPLPESTPFTPQAG